MTYPIRPITDTEWSTYSDVLSEGFGWSPHPDQITRWGEGTEFDRTLAAFDESVMVGVTGIHSFQMTVPGGRQVPTAGVTTVSVLPSHRRRGVLTSLMRRQLRDVYERGEPIAALYASEAGIYGRFGYGRAADQLTLRIATPRSAFVRNAPRDPALRLTVVKPGERRADLKRVYEAQLAERPGQYSRNEYFWDRVLADEEYDRDGMGHLRALLVEDDERVRGYALFRLRSTWTDGLPDGELHLNQLYALDPAAYALLWRGVLDRDLTARVIADGRPVDDPVGELLADPRQLRALVADELWVRVVDVPAALEARSYSAPVDLVLEVADEICPRNARRWRLTADSTGAACKPTEEEADLALPVAALGGAYLGAGSLTAQLAAGLVTERSAGAVRRLETAMSWSPKPWAGNVF